MQFPKHMLLLCHTVNMHNTFMNKQSSKYETTIPLNEFTHLNLCTLRVAIAILCTGITRERKKFYLQLVRGTLCISQASGFVNVTTLNWFVHNLKEHCHYSLNLQ